MKVNVNFATATLFVICIAVGHQNLMHPHLTVHELVVNNVVHNLFMKCLKVGKKIGQVDME